MDDIYKQSVDHHRKAKGKIALAGKTPLTTREDLALCYTPGVAGPCKEIAANPEASWELTSRREWVAVITDGTSILGLGDIGPAAGMPVMEGKCLIFKEFGGLSAFPLALKTKDIDEFVEAVKMISLSFGAINLEDIAAPRCFDIERRLKQELDIPVMHDDQHATAIVTIAGLMNALELTGRSFETARFVISGFGAAGTAVMNMLLVLGATDIIVSDRNGIVHQEREDLDDWRRSIAAYTNLDNTRGTLKDAVEGRDVFIGVSGANVLTEDMVRSMAKDPIIFALANPIPEIMPDVARRAGAYVVATGRSDFPNQVNNALAFPGVFKGVLEARARQITEPMKLAAARALASLVKNPGPDNIIPDIFDEGVVRAVSEAVIRVALNPAPRRVLPHQINNQSQLQQ